MRAPLTYVAALISAFLWDFTLFPGHLNLVLHNPQPVAFTAQLSHDMANIGAYPQLVFDNVVTNPGNAYNKTTGHFTAPQTGVYIFYVTITCFAKHSAGFYLIKNNQYLLAITPKPSLVHGNPTIPETNTHVIIERLHKGDQVYVRNNRYDPHTGLGGNNQTSFSGHMITPYFSP